MNFDGFELGWFDIFGSFSLVNQSDYLDHYNKDFYWLIVACFTTAPKVTVVRFGDKFCFEN